jgi:hypothetical protein
VPLMSPIDNINIISPISWIEYPFVLIANNDEILGKFLGVEVDFYPPNGAWYSE